MLSLDNVTLLGVDCVDINRLIFAADISEKLIQYKAIKLLTHLESNDNRVIKIPQLSSIEAYSEFMIKELYKYVDTDFVLIIQYDGFVLNPNRWTNTYLEYDYIGAPVFWGMGNGGFSLRSKTLLNVLANDDTIVEFHPEDLKICKTYRPQLEAKGIKFAPTEIAQRFSVENNTWNGQFGFHNADISLWDSSKFIDKSIPEEFIASLEIKKNQDDLITLTYVVPFYIEDHQKNPLPELLAIYSAYSRDVLKHIHFVFVDDCSKVSVNLPDNCILNYTLLRITSDITWNQGGARNLGVQHAKSEHMILTDIDVVFPENLLARLIHYKLPNNSVFKFNTIVNLKLRRPHENVFFITKSVFMRTNGVDEEFSGHYGYEDIFFTHQQKALGTKFFVFGYSNIVLREHKESKETQHYDLNRDIAVNETLLKTKLDIIESSTNPLKARSDLYLNFDWLLVAEQVLS
tara:strand:+ start:168 stop:1547 length:1380 start_codon:yes stop_codon:yes gene_type:complete